MRLLIVNNKKSGPGDAPIYDFMRAFVDDGDEVVLRTTDGSTPAEALARDAAEFDEVVIAGGDGTVTSVAYALRGTGVPILPFPAGTANLLTLNLDSPIDSPAFAKVARACDTLDFDLATIEFGDKCEGFALIAGAGYDAAVMDTATKYKASLNEMAYLFAAALNPTPTMAHFTLDLDGKIVETDGIAVIAINFGKMQFDISVTYKNNPMDGLLEIVVIKAQNNFQLLPVALGALMDPIGKTRLKQDTLEFYKAKVCTVTSDPPLNIQYDGEPTGITTPFTVRSLHNATRFVVDKNAAGIKNLMAIRQEIDEQPPIDR